jgi:hypothetical protein
VLGSLSLSLSLSDETQGWNHFSKGSVGPVIPEWRMIRTLISIGIEFKK